MDLDVVQTLGLPALVLVFLRFLTQLRAQDWDGVWKFGLAMGSGIGGTFLFAQTTQADAQSVNGVPLSSLGGADLLVLGISAGALAGGFWILTKALDRGQTAAQPTLVGPPRHDAPPQ